MHLMHVVENVRTWLWARLVFAVGTWIVIVAFLGFGDGETVGDGSLRLLLVLGPWWVVPVVIYILFVRTLFGIIVVGVGLFASVLLALEAVFADTHSTAAFGMLGFPICFALAIGAYLVLEWAGLTLVRRAGRSPW
jgi:hypothetical protein